MTLCRNVSRETFRLFAFACIRQKAQSMFFAPDGKNEFGPFEMTGTSFFAGHTMFHVKHCMPGVTNQVGRCCPHTALCGPSRHTSAANPCASLTFGYALHGFQPFLELVGLRPPFSAANPCASLAFGYALHGFQPFLALVGLRPPFSAANPCASLAFGYALHGFQPFLALVGLRPPLVAGFGLR